MKQTLRKTKLIRPLVTVALFALILFAVTAFFAARDDIDAGTLDRFLDFFRQGRGGDSFETFRFDPGRQNRYEVVNGRLVVLSPDRFAFYDTTGYERYSRSVAFRTPALTRAGDKVIVYDRAETGGFVAGQRAVLKDIPDPVMTAAGNDRGQFILVTREAGYRSVARLYDRQNRPRFAWKSSRHIMAAGLSPRGSRMAVAAVGQGGDLVGTRVTFLEVGREEPLQEIDFPDMLPLYIFYPGNSHVCIITENLVYFYTDEGELLGRYDWAGEMLLNFAAGPEALFIQTGRYVTGEYSQVSYLDYEGSPVQTLLFDDGLADMSTAGRFVSFLKPGLVTRYTITADGLQNPEQVETGARRVHQQENGSLLLLYHDHAVWALT